MCIRDRNVAGSAPEYGDDGKLRSMRNEGGVFAHPHDVIVDDEGSLYAVSYTHLRAHETVLDLVCRLLLDTKKHKKKKKKQRLWHDTALLYDKDTDHKHIHPNHA